MWPDLESPASYVCKSPSRSYKHQGRRCDGPARGVCFIFFTQSVSLNGWIYIPSSLSLNTLWEEHCAGAAGREHDFFFWSLRTSDFKSSELFGSFTSFSINREQVLQHSVLFIHYLGRVIRGHWIALIIGQLLFCNLQLFIFFHPMALLRL